MQALRIVPVAALGEALVQIRQRKAAMRDEQAVGKEQRARRVGHDSDGELAGAADPLVREILVEEVRKIRWRDGRREARTVVTERLVVIARNAGTACDERRSISSNTRSSVSRP